MANVLIVEDNADNLKLATFLLQSAGHTVISASNAEAGLALARSEPSRAHPHGHPAAGHGRAGGDRAAEAG